MSSFRNVAFRLGLRFGHYHAVRLTVAGLERAFRWTAKLLLLGMIGVGVVFAIWFVSFLAKQLNYAPLWLRAYSVCVDAQPEAVSITQALHHRQECFRLASSVTQERMR
jgi:hypothetical protein